MLDCGCWGGLHCTQVDSSACACIAARAPDSGPCQRKARPAGGIARRAALAGVAGGRAPHLEPAALARRLQLLLQHAPHLRREQTAGGRGSTDAAPTQTSPARRCRLPLQTKSALVASFWATRPSSPGCRGTARRRSCRQSRWHPAPAPRPAPEREGGSEPLQPMQPGQQLASQLLGCTAAVFFTPDSQTPGGSSACLQPHLQAALAGHHHRHQAALEARAVHPDLRRQQGRP